MISHEHRCIFVHQRRCAGTSICCAMGVDWSYDNADWHFMDSGPCSYDGEVADQEYPLYFRFSIVRNPYDRFISGWTFCESHGTPHRSILEVLRDLPRPPTDDDDPRGQVVRDWVHITRPQHEILLLPDGRLGVDYVMRYENLVADFAKVCNLMEIPQIPLPETHVNKESRDHYRTYFDTEPEAKKLLEDHFRRDLELWNYTY